MQNDKAYKIVQNILSQGWINSSDPDIISSWANGAIYRESPIFVGIFCKYYVRWGSKNFRIYRFSKLSKYIDNQYKTLKIE